MTLAGTTPGKCGVFQKVSWKEQCQGEPVLQDKTLLHSQPDARYPTHTDLLSALPQSRGLSLKGLLRGILLLV